MKRRQLYRHLVEIAQKAGIRVVEQNLRATGVNARSGLCRIRGEPVFIMDKHLAVNEKIEILAGCLRELPLDEIYIVPAIRNLLEHGSV